MSTKGSETELASILRAFLINESHAAKPKRNKRRETIKEIVNE